jgi:AcrR family transcriptional regulator
MKIEPKTRSYKQRARAELQEKTRIRITEAAMELHGSVGPAKTSISAVAERAGVQRATLYRYFPDDEALFAACSAHWMAANPPPNLAAWAEIDDPDERTATALKELYAYYKRNDAMFANLHRDESLHPAIPPLFAAFRALLDTSVEILMQGRGLKGRDASRTRGAAKHAVAFTTWSSLAKTGNLRQADATRLMTGLIANAAGEAG